MIGMGVLEIFLSQIPNFHRLSLLSVVAAIMSFAYSSIGVGLALTRIISGDGTIFSSVFSPLALNHLQLLVLMSLLVFSSNFVFCFFCVVPRLHNLITVVTEVRVLSRARRND